MVRGVATSYYVRIKRGREYERTRTEYGFLPKKIS